MTREDLLRLLKMIRLKSRWFGLALILLKCRLIAENGLDFRQDQNYLATYVMRGASQCFILSYDRMVRREEVCDDFGPNLFKPTYPYQVRIILSKSI